MPDRLANIEDALARGRRVDREELEWMVERLRVLEGVVCDFAWSRYEACPACEAGQATDEEHEHGDLADCLCDAIGDARRGIEERLLEAARERLPPGRTGRNEKRRG